MATPPSPEAFATIQRRFELGVERLNAGDCAESEAIFRRIVADRPDIPEAHFNLGVVLLRLQKIPETIAAFRAALALRPAYQEAWNNLGVIYRESKQPAEAIPAYRQALALRPDLSKTWVNLALAYQDTGQIDEARACYDRAIALAPQEATPQSSRIHVLHYHSAFDAAALYRETRNWNERFAAPLAREIRPHDNDRSPQRVLRVGYVSSDFRSHCQSAFTKPLLTYHDRRQFEIFCYSTVTTADGVTARLRSVAQAWREIARVSEAAAAQMIRQDRIDILVDLSLHTAGNRLLVFARKPAPVQVTWLGYPGSTGMDAIDYRLTDSWLDPVGEQIRNPKSDPGAPGRINDPNPNDGIPNGPDSPINSNELKPLPHSDIGKLRFDSDFGFRASDFATKEPYYSERSVRLPDSYWCYDPHGTDALPELLPEPGPLPALAAGFVTFGCLNTFFKISDRTLALWSGVMAAVPNSRLLLFAPPGPHRQWVWQKLGVAAERVRFVAFQPWRQYLATYRQIDLCLDTLPFNGGTTSLDALWMGVPVVTRVGETIVGRAGVSHLHNLGLPELVAAGDEEFVRIAAGLAGDLQRLAALRETLRQRLEQSPLMDGLRFARNVEAAYRQMWRAWCAQGPQPR